jgi:FOG: WD40 repeat
MVCYFCWQACKALEYFRRNRNPHVSRPRYKYPSCCFFPDSKYLATGGTKLIIWEATSGLKFPRKSFAVEHNVQGIAFSPDSKLVARSTASKVGVWNIRSGEELFKFRHPTSSGVPLIFASVGKRLIYYPSGDCRMWTQDLITGDFFISTTPNTRLKTFVTNVWDCANLFPR